MTTTPDQPLVAGAHLERERIRTICRLPEAKGREASALAVALDTSMSPEAAAKLLATMPKASPFPAGSRSCDSPIGLVIDAVDGKPMTAEQVAARVNAEPPQ